MFNIIFSVFWLSIFLKFSQTEIHVDGTSSEAAILYTKKLPAKTTAHIVLVNSSDDNADSWVCWCVQEFQ